MIKDSIKKESPRENVDALQFLVEKIKTKCVNEIEQGEMK